MLYYENKKFKLYCGDCLEILPELETNSVDLVITDPPYGQTYKATGFRKLDLPESSIANDNKEFNFSNYLDEILRVLRSSRHLYVFSPGAKQAVDKRLADVKQAVDKRPASVTWTVDKRLAGVTELIWDKQIMGSGDLSLPWGLEHEKIIFAVNGKRYGKVAANRGKLAGRLRRGTVLNYQRLNGSEIKNHLTEKPVRLLREFVESSSMFDDIVLDCFCGSGSTLEAALREERKAIGIEISEKNCEQIVKRLKNL